MRNGPRAKIFTSHTREPRISLCFHKSLHFGLFLWLSNLPQVFPLFPRRLHTPIAAKITDYPTERAVEGDCAIKAGELVRPADGAASFRLR